MAEADPARAPEVAAPGSSNAASASSELFRPDIDWDLRATMMEMEEVAGTARACQSYVRSIQ